MSFWEEGRGILSGPDPGHVVVLAEIAEIAVQFLDALFVGFCAFAFEAVVELMGRRVGMSAFFPFPNKRVKVEGGGWAYSSPSPFFVSEFGFGFVSGLEVFCFGFA